MAITLIATPGAIDANSYATVAEADAYFEAHLYGETWTEMGVEEKKAALIMATRLLDATYAWTGETAGATQALPWPRTSMLDRRDFLILDTVVPNELKYATIELAQALRVANRTAESDTEGIKKVKAGSVEVEFKDSGGASKPIPDVVRNFLVLSWYETVAEEIAVFRMT